MIYATQDDLTRRFGEWELAQLTDNVHRPPSVIDATRVALALADASTLIDGYLGVLYRLPLRGCLKPAIVTGGVDEYVPPPQLVPICCDLARALLYSTYLPPEHEVSQRRKHALDDLDKLSRGKTALSCPWGGEPGDVLSTTPQTEADLSYSFSRRGVTDDELRGF
jgi:phage gp36-like protein